MNDSALLMVPTYATAAARTGHPAAQRTLGFLYRTGRGVQADTFQAEAPFTAAAKAGDAYAAFNLASMHINSDARGRDHDDCLRLLRQAVEGGVTQAAAVLGDRLTAIDEDAEALSWYLHAADRGHAGAMFAAACWYRDGLGIAPAPVQAVRWFLATLDRCRLRSLDPTTFVIKGVDCSAAESDRRRDRGRDVPTWTAVLRRAVCPVLRPSRKRRTPSRQ